MNAIAQREQVGLPAAVTSRMAVPEIVGHAAMVQEVMKAVMKPEVHYGTIPGTDKPTLLKPGAEVLCMTFRIGDEYAVEDLSTNDQIRYRSTCTGRHQTTGVVLGSGMGEASSSEEKYKWRKAVCDEEYEVTPPQLRRVKYGKKKGGGFYTAQQVRTEPADMANTVLKMANKRAKMAMVLNVLAASDCFTQDLEDLDRTLRDHLAGDDEELEPYPDDKFKENLAGWHSTIKSGKYTADALIVMLEKRATFTDDQKAKIREASNVEGPRAKSDAAGVSPAAATDATTEKANAAVSDSAVGAGDAASATAMADAQAQAQGGVESAAVTQPATQASQPIPATGGIANGASAPAGTNGKNGQHPDTKAPTGAVKMLRQKAEGAGKTEAEVCQHVGAKSFDEITIPQLNAGLAWLRQD